MHIYAGTFLLALAMLALEITLTRLLSVTTWYHLAFFAISAAMLGMTAGATNVYLHPKRFSGERLAENLGRVCLRFAWAVLAGLVVVCLTPATPATAAPPSLMSLLAMLVLTGACALPFYYAGIAVTLVLTKPALPVGKVYASDLVGASMGCFLVLGGLQWLDAPSLIVLCGAIGALAGSVFQCSRHTVQCSRHTPCAEIDESSQHTPCAEIDESSRHTPCAVADAIASRGHATPPSLVPAASQAKLRKANLIAAGSLALLAVLNSLSPAMIRPFMIKGAAVSATEYDLDQWNSFSRVAVRPVVNDLPHLWAPSPLMPTDLVRQRGMTIDGSAGTVMREFRTDADLDHLRYDVTNVAYYLRPRGSACIIGVGGGRDVQTAVLFGCSPIVGIELNPIFIHLLENEYRQFANIADRPEVRLVVDEARSYLSRHDAKYRLMQMSLIDTWAATGAGAMMLSENALYTVEAWKLFLDRLDDDGLFTVSRWYDEKNLGETGRLLSLAVAALLERGVHEPWRHIALATRGRVATLILSRQPLRQDDIAKLHETCRRLGFTVAASPGTSVGHPILRAILGSTSLADLRKTVEDSPLRFDPPTDDDPYFFNILRLRNLAGCFTITSPGAMQGNLVATLTLAGLILGLGVMTVATILVPLLLRGRVGEVDAPRPPVLWAGAAYFSLIGAGFMLLEIAMIQRLSVFLGHPVYALAVLLFTFILSAGIGSLLSERLPLGRAPWAFLYPPLACAAIMATRLALAAITARMVPDPMGTKIAVSIATIFPMGIVLGLFFPTGMRLVRRIEPQQTPWYWALNGVFGVLASAVAVFISVFGGISINFYVAAACYALVLICVISLVTSTTARSPQPVPP